MKQRVRCASRGVVLCLAGVVGLFSCAAPSSGVACNGQVLPEHGASIVVDVLTFEGRVTRDGRPLAPVDEGFSRGRLFFESDRTQTRAMVDLESRSGGTFKISLPPAVYRVRWVAPLDSPSAPTWNIASGSILDEALDLRAPRRVEIDVTPQPVTLDLRVDGRAPSTRVHVRLESLSLPSSWGGADSMTVDGRTSFDVAGHGSRYRASVGAALAENFCADLDRGVPCELRSIGEIQVGDRPRAIDLETVVSTIELEVDGRRMPAADGVFSLRLQSPEVSVGHPTVGVARRFWRGRYDVSVAHGNERVVGIPTNRATLATSVPFEHDGPVTIRARTAALTQRFRVEGVPIERLRASGVEPSLLLLDREGNELYREPITSAGQQFRVFHTDAAVAVELEGACDLAHPCGLGIVRPFGRIDRDMELFYEAPLACISLVVTENDRRPDPGLLNNIAARPVGSNRSFSIRVPAASNGVMHILAGTYEVSSRTTADAARPSVELAVTRRWEGTRVDRVDLRTHNARFEFRVRDLVTRDEVPLTYGLLEFVDSTARTFAATEQSAGVFSALVPTSPLRGVVRASTCSLDPPTRSVCFTTPVFGCDR